MIPRRAVLTGFFDLPQTEVVYPETGVLTVTGKNGRGKTARYLEAIAWAGWGETLRGTPPGECVVVLETDRVVIERSLQRPRRLRWNYHGQEPVKFETPTKADAALEKELGSFYSWVRSSVFSSSDASLFSAGSDPDRKKLLEKLIGVGVFDNAVSLVKAHVEDLNLKLAAITKEEAVVSARIMETRSAVTEMLEVASVPPPEADIDTLRVRESDLIRTHRSLQGDYQRAMQAANVLQGKIQAFERSHSFVVNGQCRTCGQAVPADTLATQREELDRLVADADAAKAEADRKRDIVSTEIHRLELDLNQVRQTLAEAAKYNPAAAEKVAALRARGRDMVRQLTSLQQDRAFYEDQLTIMKHVVAALGVRGVRSALLSGALAKLQDLANAYLGWLSTGVSLEIRGQTETQKGTTQEKIDILVHGLGGGHGYKALSGGERRRIDLVLLLALASLSRNRGTLIFDEAFDALDSDGLAAAFQLILRLSEQRPVIVISHNKELIEPLSKAGQLVVL